MPTYGPTARPSAIPSSEPTYAPTLAPTKSPLRDPFDCANHPYPIQVLRYEDSPKYTVRELNANTGNYDFVFLIDYFDGHVNAAAMLDAGDDNYYLLASFGGYLCVFDEEGLDCYDEPLELESPNVGVTIGTTFYYGKNLGRDGGEELYHVTNMAGPYGAGGVPVFRGDASFAFSGDLFEGSVLDLAAAVESGGAVYVDDGYDGAAYLFGLGYQFEVVVIRVDPDSTEPLGYAVLGSTVDWGAADAEDGDSGYGAAYAFAGYDGTRIFFSSNVGYGLFEVELPLTIDSDCWNDDDDIDDHVFCGSDTAKITRLSDAVFTSYNDGTNCPDATTYAGTPAPSAAAISVSAFDCDAHPLPLQVLRYEDAAEYSVRELNVDTGLYELIYSIDDFDGHVNAVAMYASAAGVYYALGAFAGELCWFDETGRICDGALASTKPNAAALLGDTYYYAKSPGDYDGDHIWFVRDVAGDRVRVDDALFEIAAGLYAGAVLDFVGVDEGDSARYDGSGVEYVDDDEYSGKYLVGIAEDYSVFVARIDDDGYPEAYAVLPSTVDWDGAAVETGDSGGFGAAYVVYGSSRDRLLFTSNAGFGLFELETPFTVPEACWNSGTDTDDHAFCDEAAPAALVRRADSALTNYNDGMNCPESTFLADEEDRRRRRRRLRGRSSGRSWS